MTPEIINDAIVLFQEHSIVSIVLATAFVAFIRCLHEAKKMASLLSEVVDNISSTTEKYRRKHTKLTTLADIDNTVIEKLEGIMGEVGCDRICLMQYHNGEHTLNGLDFIRMTCTHEVINKHMKSKSKSGKSVQLRFVGVPLTAYQFFSKELLQRSFVIVPDIDILKDTHISTYEELKCHGVKSVVAVSLKNMEGADVGYLVAEFCDNKIKKTAETGQLLVDSAARIAALLEITGVFQENIITTGLNKDGFKKRILKKIHAATIR